MKYFFMIFSPTVCHRHTSTLCMAGKGDSVDGVVTVTCLDQPWGPPRLVYSSKWLTFLGAQHSGHGAVYSSQCSADIKNQQSVTCAPSVCYRWHVMQCPFPNAYVCLIVHELNFYISAQKKSNKHKRCEILGISKENLLHPIQQCVQLLRNSKKGTVQCLVPKITLQFFLVGKYKYFLYIYK